MDRRIPLRPARRLGGAPLALALFAALATPAHAAPRGEGPFFASAWRLLSALWAETGLEFDPGGLNAPAPPTSDTGLVADPGGRSQPRVLFGETGLVFDPSGLAAPTPGNIGQEADPNG